MMKKVLNISFVFVKWWALDSEAFEVFRGTWMGSITRRILHSMSMAFLGSQGRYFEYSHHRGLDSIFEA